MKYFGNWFYLVLVAVLIIILTIAFVQSIIWQKTPPPQNTSSTATTGQLNNLST